MCCDITGQPVTLLSCQTIVQAQHCTAMLAHGLSQDLIRQQPMPAHGLGQDPIRQQTEG